MNKAKRLMAVILSLAFVVSTFTVVPKTVYGATKLSIPVVHYYLDGDVFELSWDSIPNATSYVLTINGKENVLTSTSAKFAATTGATYECSLVAQTNKSNYSSSDKKLFRLNAPTYTYTKISPETAALISNTQLMKWISANSYKYEAYQEDGYYIVHVILEDELNNKLAHKFGRGLAGGLDGLIGGTKKGINQITFDNIASDALQNYLESNSKKQAVKDTAKGTLSNIGLEGLSGSLSGIKTYLSQDTNKHYYYYYEMKDSPYSCTLMLSNFEEIARESYKRETEQQCKMDSNGLYYMTTDLFNRNVIIDVNEVDTGTLYPKWFQAIVPVKAPAK